MTSWHDPYGPDVLATARAAQQARRAPAPTLALTAGVVLEVVGDDFVGAVVAVDAGTVTLEDRRGRTRVFPLVPAGFRHEGALVTPVRPPTTARPPGRTASGSVAVPDTRARVARAGRIYVEGVHDAALVEQVWGADLRVEGVVVEPLHGVDDLAAAVRAFQPRPQARLGVLVDHLVPGSKESTLVAQVRHRDVLVLGHPYVDIWQAVRPAALRIPGWPTVPRGEDWKTGAAARLGVRGGAPELWRRVRAAVVSYADLEVPLLRAMEELIDFVTAPTGDHSA